MLFFLIALVFVCLWRVKFASFHEGYIDKDQTTSIKGIFAIIIIFSHVLGYVSLTNYFFDTWFKQIIAIIGQLMVTMFFFYSGFGVAKQFQKNVDYRKDFLRTRILKTLVHFDIAVLCFAILALILQREYSWKWYLLSFTGWVAIGNSNWFVFVTLALYTLTLIGFFISTKFFKKNRLIAFAIIISIFSVALFVVLYFLKEIYWYDTLLCYSVGVWYAVLKHKVDVFLKTHKVLSHIVTIATVLVFILCRLILRRILPGFIADSLTAIVFCLALVFITTKIKMDNPILRWLGKYSFLIYILQRIPMIIFAEIGLNIYPHLFFVVVFVLTLGLSYVMNILYEKIDSKFFAKKIKKYTEENKYVEEGK